ncbi:MAG: alpha-galactosidase [Selenomonadaceae bacterium]|nr:alpha-galactosidase [Selenomonadaceae bacterium]
MIKYDKNFFHITNGKISYVIEISRGRYLFHRYFGKAIREFRDSAPLQGLDRGFSPQPAAWENERTYSLDVLPQEYPMRGHSDFRIPAYEIELPDGTNIVELFYTGHKIYNGKPALKNLPASYAKENEAQTLEIYLEDTVSKIKATLIYTIYEKFSLIVRSVRFENFGDKPFKLRQAASFAIDLPDHEFDSINLYGGHAAERFIERKPLGHGIYEVASSRGASSHQQSPFIALARHETTEHQGEIYGFSFVYSGSFSAKVEVEQFGTTRLVMGLNPATFSWQLDGGESFQTPEVVAVYSDGGINAMSQTFHEFYRNHLVRGKFQHELRPILVNNWEATYFDFDAQKISELADCAKELGIELLVLDDGWFGKRNDDNSSLGDWFVNEEKLPAGLKDLAEKVHARGLKFGLWFEPEMTNLDSELYRKHPDWILRVEKYPMSFGRHQLVLDLVRQDVRDYLVEVVCKILRENPIDYVKWDMNRHMTEAFSLTLPPERRMESQHRYMLGVYDIMERITSAFPNILFESCSGGGGRFDAGILYYMPQTWTSDNTDAVCRLSIQKGTSYVFPPLTMGAHVSVTPNHQVGRVTPMQMRAFCAMLGCFGYELDICKMSDEDKELVKKHIALYKKIQPTMQLGKFTRLLSEENETAWQFTAQDGKQVVMTYFKILSQPAHNLRKIKMAGLDAEKIYKLTTYVPPKKLSVDGGPQDTSFEEKDFYGDELMYNGVMVEKVETDFAAYMWVFNRVD